VPAASTTQRSAQTAEERPLVVAGPAAERHAVDTDRRGGEQVDDADVDAGADEVDLVDRAWKSDAEPVDEAGEVGGARPWDHDEAHDRGGHDEARREEEQRLVDTGRVVVLLQHELHAVSDRLEEALRPDPVGADAVLHPCAELALEHDRVRASTKDHVDHREDESDVDEKLDDFRRELEVETRGHREESLA
jgi:hypothetical protein